MARHSIAAIAKKRALTVEVCFYSLASRCLFLLLCLGTPWFLVPWFLVPFFVGGESTFRLSSDSAHAPGVALAGRHLEGLPRSDGLLARAEALGLGWVTQNYFWGALKLQCVGEFGGWKVCFRVGVGESCAFSVFDMVGVCFLRAWDKANGQGVC